VPQKAGDLEVVVSFMEVQVAKGGASETAEAVGEQGEGEEELLSPEAEEEVEALEAIFMDDFSRSSPRIISIRLSGCGVEENAPSAPFRLVFTLGAGYPAREAPGVEVVGPLGGRDPRRDALAGLIATTAEECAQQPMVYTIVEQVKAYGFLSSL
jgi:hypothetical protein